MDIKEMTSKKKLPITPDEILKLSDDLITEQKAKDAAEIQQAVDNFSDLFGRKVLEAAAQGKKSAKIVFATRFDSTEEFDNLVKQTVLETYDFDDYTLVDSPTWCIEVEWE